MNQHPFSSPDNPPPRGKLTLHWIRNVLLYHYKWWILAGVAVLSMIALNIYFSVTTPKPDASGVLLVMGQAVPRETADTLSAALADKIGDTNEDGRLLFDLQLLDLTVRSDTFGYEAAFAKVQSALANLPLALKDESVSFFLCDAAAKQTLIERFAAPETFADPEGVALGRTALGVEFPEELWLFVRTDAPDAGNVFASPS